MSKRYIWTSHSAEAKLFLGWNLREVSLVASLAENWVMQHAVSFPASHNRPENIPHIKQDAPITQLAAASATGTGRLYFLSQRSMLTTSWHWFWKEPANQKNGCKNIKNKWLKTEKNLERWNATYSSFYSLLSYVLNSNLPLHGGQTNIYRPHLFHLLSRIWLLLLMLGMAPKSFNVFMS